MGVSSVIKTKTQGKNYVNAFASAVAALSRAREDLTARVLEMLVSDFDAARAELGCGTPLPAPAISPMPRV